MQDKTISKTRQISLSNNNIFKQQELAFGTTCHEACWIIYRNGFIARLYVSLEVVDVEKLPR